ncbi:MAG: hypothetical protein U0793_09260 [Gemmataceae bacterium]
MTRLTFRKIRASPAVPSFIAPVGPIWLIGLAVSLFLAGLGLLAGRGVSEWILFTFFFASAVVFLLIWLLVVGSSVWTGETLRKELRGVGAGPLGSTLKTYEVMPCRRGEEFVLYWVEIAVLCIHMYVLIALNLGLAYIMFSSATGIHF